MEYSASPGSSQMKVFTKNEPRPPVAGAGHRSRSCRKEGTREPFHETVDNRVPYYGEYMVRDDDGEWTFNEEYIDA